MQPSSTTTRRRFIASTAASTALLLGCNQQPTDTPASSTSTRRDVPLRVLLCGNERWAEVLKTAWSAIAEQQLQINLLDPATIEPAQWQAKAVEAMNRCDVAIVPAGLLPAIDGASGLTPPTDNLLGEQNVNADRFYPVLREGLMKYGGRTVAVPLGALQPALVLRTDGLDVARPTDWNGYIELATQLNGKASTSVVAEPLAGGAAARMFLWRVNASQPPVWLFDRESFAPVIDTKPYVDALETMKACADAYGAEKLSAGEVWSRVATGKLQMAIAWPAAHANDERIEEANDCEFATLPMVVPTNSVPAQTLVDYESPVALISSHCRQSEAAARLVTWLAGGEGTSMMRSLISGLTELRRGIDEASRKSSTTESNDAGEVSASGYSNVLAKTLSSLSIRTPLQLLQYRRYAAALDAAVLSCLDGKQSAQAALSSTAESWTELTKEIGLKSQSKAWHKAQGLRS